jgi:uncharacterized protein YecE (DUF72 family)
MDHRLHIGTSGWHYDHWRGPFYPADIRSEQMLDFYARKFQTVEINNSFYHLPSEKTFQAWKDQTPPGFLFAVKANRYITHMKKLKEPEKPLEKFFAHAEALGLKLGPVLFQLPPHWGRNRERLEEFLRALPAGGRYAFEFRDPSWFHEEILALLEKHQAAFCVYDLAGQESPRALTAGFAYLRLHGPAGEKYSGRYTRAQLHGWLECCRDGLRQGAREVFVYFDNDPSGFAALNARELVDMAGEAG